MIIAVKYLSSCAHVLFMLLLGLSDVPVAQCGFDMVLSVPSTGD